jgi:hypothetical protein
VILWSKDSAIAKEVGAIQQPKRMAWKTALQFTVVTGVGLAGWFTGILTERRERSKTTCECSCINQNTGDNLLSKIKGMPGLPIFGTVSAASSPENKLSILGSDLVPLESSPVQSKPNRVPQVNKYIFIYIPLRRTWIIL